MECLYLKWVDYKTSNKYIIGALCRDKENKKYFFKLDADYMRKAEKSGFSPAVLPFSHVNKIYESETLFPMFRMRVPRIENMDKDELEELLEEVGLKEFDEFEFLKKTKGESVLDRFILEESRNN